MFSITLRPLLTTYTWHAINCVCAFYFAASFMTVNNYLKILNILHSNYTLFFNCKLFPSIMFCTSFVLLVYYPYVLFLFLTHSVTFVIITWALFNPCVISTFVFLHQANLLCCCPWSSTEHASICIFLLYRYKGHSVYQGSVALYSLLTVSNKDEIRLLVSIYTAVLMQCCFIRQGKQCLTLQFTYIYIDV
jgi:hypothetical protein